MTTLRIFLFVASGLALMGCGADGEPVQPTLNANVGVGSSGAYVGGGVGLHTGPLSIFLGI